ncbi:MAG: sigma 54-interacting transcriptional regulator [Pseudomonadota bacterium]
MKNEIQYSDSPNTCMMVLSTSFGIMSANPAACQLLGTALQPGETYSPEKMFDRQSLGTARKLLEEVFNKGGTINQTEACFAHKSGGRVQCWISASPLISRSHEILGVMLLFKTQSRKKRQGSTLSTLRYLPRVNYQGVFDGLPEGVFSVDTSWKVNSFNKTAESLTGYERKAVLGKYCWEVFQSGSCKQECPLAKVIRGGKSFEREEVTIINQKGLRQKLIVNVNSLKDQDGTIVGGIECFRSEPLSQKVPGKFQDNYVFEGMIGNTKAMKEIFIMLPDVAGSRSSVLISGESGTGKELIARAIHNLSNKHQGKFVGVNCSSLPESLLESELFGHEKGAFTGADMEKPGRFELAENGTLLLDEIGELKPSLQVKLLRVLEQKEFERVGGSRPIRLTARVIGATNQNLEKALENGMFREDLYYRLRTIPIRIPPLRERVEDIPLLVNHFIKQFNLKYNKSVRLVDPKVIDFFTTYHWPGNIRELERCMEHAFVFAKGPVIFSRHLPEIGEFQKAGFMKKSEGRHSDTGKMIRALNETGGKRNEAAQILGISRTSMWRKMKAAGLV